MDENESHRSSAAAEWFWNLPVDFHRKQKTEIGWFSREKWVIIRLKSKNENCENRT